MRRAETLAVWPVSKPTTAAGKKLAAIHAEWTEAHERIAGVERDYAAAQEALKVASADLETALYEAAKSRKPGKGVADAEAAHAKAKAEAGAAWEQRLEAPIRVAEDRRAAYGRHLTDNLVEILSEPELAGEAEKARDEVLEKAQELDQAFARWQRSREAHQAAISYADGITGQAIPFVSGSASAARSAVESLIAAQTTGRPAGGDPLPLPCPSKRDLDRRAIARGEAEEVPVDGPNGKGVQVVPTA